MRMSEGQCSQDNDESSCGLVAGYAVRALMIQKQPLGRCTLVSGVCRCVRARGSGLYQIYEQ